MFTRWLGFWDTHGDEADTDALAGAFDFAERWKPKVRIAGGDHMDVRWLRGRATVREQSDDVKADIDAGLDFLKRFKPTHYLWGNHENRLVENGLGSHMGETRAFAQEVIDKMERAAGPNCAHFQYSVRRGVLDIHGQRFIHGFQHGINAAQMAARTFGDVIQGHAHGIDAVSVGHYPRRVVGMVCGCLCNLEMGYAVRGAANLKWEHGFPYGLIDERRARVHVYQARRHEDGTWFFPSEAAP